MLKSLLLIFCLYIIYFYEKDGYNYIIRLIKYFINIMQVLKNLPPLPNRKNTTQVQPNTTRLALAPYIRPYKIQSLKNKLQLFQSQQYQSQRNNKSLSKRLKSAQSNQSTNSQSNSCENLSKIKKNTIITKQNNQMVFYELPDITAKSWVLYQLRENNCIYGKRNYKKRQIASLIKIMNLVTILGIIQKFNINPNKLKVKPTKNAIAINGTTAQLKYTHIYSLYDLLFGMMLPSGNDSAYLIAQIGGYILKLEKQNSHINLNQIYNNAQSLIDQLDKNNNFVNIYLKEMNKMAQKLQMFNSNFVNPHGLSNTYNYSTANDLVKLCSYALKNKMFRQIVTTKIYQYRIEQYFNFEENKENIEVNYNDNGKFLHQKRYLNGSWENTNKMLSQGWSGIKTGITPNAGPCLSASFATTINNREYQFLVILLNSQSMQARWEEVRRLVSWAIQKKYYL